MAIRLLALVALFALSPPTLLAGTAQAPDETATVQQEFDNVFRQWKETLKEIRGVEVKYHVATPEEQKSLQKQFRELIDQAKQLVPALKRTAEKAYVAAPNKNKDVADFLGSVFNSEMNDDSYEEALRIGAILLENQAKVAKLEILTGIAAFNVGQYDLAEKYFKAGGNEVPTAGQNSSPYEQRMAQAAQVAMGMLPEYRKKWAKEQEIRAAEAKADDLPRVKLETSKGDIVIELFENEAPNSTANFISLVEQGFYNGLSFHRVIPGFMAQGGCPQGTGQGGPGYSIACECHLPNIREHFRGTLSMAHAGRDSGGSQFFLTFVPTPHLDKLHTAFGRVIEGMDVLARLQRDPGKPKPADKIVKATVIRKRDHKYEPKKLPEKL